MQLNAKKKYDAFCSHIFDYACLSLRFIAIKEVRNYRKLYTSKTLLKMVGGKMHTSHPGPTPLDPPLTISYRNHQKSLTYFSNLAPLVLFFFTKRQSQQSQNGVGMAQCPPF